MEDNTIESIFCNLSLQQENCDVWCQELVNYFTRLTCNEMVVNIKLTKDDTGFDKYEVNWEKNNLKVSGNSTAAIFHGIQYAIKHWRQNEISNMKVTRTSLCKERGLSIDIGRKYFSKQWLFQLINKMASLEMNVLHLHFSENEGFRIESQKFPDVPSEECLSKEDIRELINYANRKFIEIIPEIDSPGHLGYFLRNKKEWQLSDDKPHIKGHALNILNREAVNAVKELIEEYMTLFSTSRYFHLGADEYIPFERIRTYPDLVEAAKKRYGPDASGLEPYVEYVNDLIELTHRKGFIPRVWNDGLYRTDVRSKVSLRKDVEICYWTKWHRGMAKVETFLKNGHNVVNYNDGYFYYVLGEAAGYKYPTRSKISKWEPHVYSGNQKVDTEYLQNSLGNYFAIWSDVPDAQTEDEILIGISDPLEAVQEKVWVTDY